VKKKRRFGFLFAIDDDIDDQNWLRRNEELWVHTLANSKLVLPP
jgi:hypothetical protein